jgi:hypothetical protein
VLIAVVTAGCGSSEQTTAAGSGQLTPKQIRDVTAYVTQRIANK